MILLIIRMIIGVIIFAKIISFIYYDKKLRVKKIVYLFVIQFVRRVLSFDFFSGCMAGDWKGNKYSKDECFFVIIVLDNVVKL